MNCATKALCSSTVQPKHCATKALCGATVQATKALSTPTTQHIMPSWFDKQLIGLEMAAQTANYYC